MDRQEILKNYPFCGKLTHCSEKGDYGIIKYSTGEFFVHISGFNGDSENRPYSMQALVGESFAFVVGGDPFRYKQNRSGWKKVVVQWNPLDSNLMNLTPSNYEKERASALDSLDITQMQSLLEAEWYVSLWRKKSNSKPAAKLIVDTPLENALQDLLEGFPSLPDTLQLLKSIASSPYYASPEITHVEILKHFVARSEFSERLAMLSGEKEECEKYTMVWPLIEKRVLNERFKGEVVAIDLESDGEQIFQFGWFNSRGNGLKKGNSLSCDELQVGMQECLPSLNPPCFVGHNILAWDWPILQRQGIENLPPNPRIWDTLVTSWLLEPWKSSHALVVKKNAHRADADAKASFELFESQYHQLKSKLDQWSVPGTVQLIEQLYDDLAEIPGCKYPDDLRGENLQFNLFPTSRRSELSWQVGCRIELLAPEKASQDPVLSPEICVQVAEELGGLYPQMVSVIVANSCRENVQVRLSMIPRWVFKNASGDLRDALLTHHQNTGREKHDATFRCYLTGDLFRMPKKNAASLIIGNNINVHYFGEVFRDWCAAYAENLSEMDVEQRFPDIPRLTGRALFCVKEKDEKPSAWLLYEPVSMDAGQSSWMLFPQRPSWLPDADGSKVETKVFDRWVQCPRWMDGAAAQLEMDRLFVSPDTDNRKIYLADVLHCLLNLIRHGGDAERFMLVAMRCRNEAEKLQDFLIKLSCSATHFGSPLRKLEYAEKQQFKLMVCSHAELPKYIEAANDLHVEYQVVLDEAPLLEWHCLLNQPDVSADTNTAEEWTEPQFEGESAADDADSEVQVISPEKTVLPVRIKQQEIRDGVSHFLIHWLHGVLKDDSEPVVPVLLLDSRLHSLRRLLTEEDIPFFDLEELLNAKKQEVYYNICFPHTQKREVPNTYEAYEVFLKKNWKDQKGKSYPGFRKSQQSVIHALVNDRKEILLRLPTGEGKSLVFHLPALLRAEYTGRLTIVITPLRALMADQVQGLWNRHFTESVDYLSGGRDPWINQEVYSGVLDGRIKLLFVAPERFRVERFVEVVERRRRMDDGLEFIVFDEAHCVSEWGFEFRPDYLYAARYVADWFKKKDRPGNPHRLILASATVTQRNRSDLEKELGLEKGKYADLPENMPHPIQDFIILESFDTPEFNDSPECPKVEKIVEIIGKLDLSVSAAIVFVRRRKDCHRISEYLNAIASKEESPLPKMKALPFHAGLPEEVKTETCTALKAEMANVLVCTKAFGMGMDIPHLHACIHHRPPAFIEDYLQEVGRIGRDEEKRKLTGNEQVIASLLFNQEDLERNISMMQDKAIRPPDLQDFMAFCSGRAVAFPAVEKYLCFVPGEVRVNGGRKFDENQVSSCLFWLERAGVLKLEGRHPPFIRLSVRKNVLRNISGNSTKAARVAKALLSIVGGSIKAVAAQVQATPIERKAAESAFGRFIRGLTRGLLALVDPVQAKANPPQAVGATNTQNDSAPVDISVSMQELMKATEVAGMDELYRQLFELRKAGGLEIHKELIVVQSSIPSTGTFWKLLRHAVDRLMQPTNGGVEFILRKVFKEELDKWYEGELKTGSADDGVTQSVLSPSQREREVYRAINTSLKLVRFAGCEVKESLTEDGSTQYARFIGASAYEQERSRETLLKDLKTLAVWLDSQNSGAGATFEISLTDVVDKLGGETPISQIKKLMQLLATSGFFGLEGSLSEWVSIVSLNSVKPLSNRDELFTSTNQPENKIQGVYFEMVERHRLQELRAHCMVLLALMPGDARKNFIDQYFEAQTAEEIQKLIEGTVGDVDSDVLQENEMLSGLLAQVQQQRFQDEMDRLNDQQHKICKTPFNQHLLVNAGPGSGKTHVLMMRCAHLIHRQGINPSRILVLAFNRAVVSEIRKRVTGLFKELGYGSYANRLVVSTFHSFALRHEKPVDKFDDGSIAEAVHRFANKIAGSNDFAQQIARIYSAVLVDEFQDMNEDFYRVVVGLATECHGGAMVIGDDDQDILTWNRRKWNQDHGRQAPLEAIHYFQKFASRFKPATHELTLNYRSLPTVVSRANGMIAKMCEEIGFERMKADIELVAVRKGDGRKAGFHGWGEGLDHVWNLYSDNAGIAALCRSNAECRQAYQQLIGRGVDRGRIKLLGGVDLALYQHRTYGALMDLFGKREPYGFIDKYVWDEITADFKDLGHADANKVVGLLDEFYDLVKIEYGRPRASDIIDFIYEMKLSDLDRLRKYSDTGLITVSTINKVKGLAFDNVVIMPSSQKFPLSNNAPSLEDSAEEARLYYVAMTRAKNNLFCGFGPRVTAWRKTESFDGQEGTRIQFLEGSPKEVFVSWPGQVTQVSNGLQRYIEQDLRCDDQLELRYGKAMYHRNRIIGSLSNDQVDGNANLAQMQFRVLQIMRYTCGPYMKQNKRHFWDKLDASIQQQCWCYTILVESF